jgi:hypothetical protein
VCPAFAFVSVAPFGGTFQLYDAAPAMSTLFSFLPSIFFVIDAKPKTPKPKSFRIREGRGGALAAFCNSLRP